MKTREELFQFADDAFREQMGLDLSEILKIENGRFSITSDNRLGLSMGSLQLDLDRDGHGNIASLLEKINEDFHV
jgi:hypothetical protein